MRKFGAVVMAAVVALVICAPAYAQNVKWVTEPVPYSDGTFVKSMSVAKDSLKTSIIDTSQWAWDAIFQNRTASTGPGVTLSFVTTAAGADSILFQMNYKLGDYESRSESFFDGSGGAAGQNCALPSQHITGATGDGKVFLAPLYSTPNSTSAPLFWLRPPFRIVLRDNAAGSAAVTNLRIYITYPKYVQSAYTWQFVPIKFVRSAGLRDTVNIAAAKDSVRTAAVDLSDAAWELMRSVQGTTPGNAAVYFTTTSALTGTSADSIYYGVETGAQGNFCRIDPFNIAAATTSVAQWGNFNTFTNDIRGRMFMGFITTEPDAWIGVNNSIFARPQFRLFIRANTGSTVSGLRGWVVYPRRRV